MSYDPPIAVVGLGCVFPGAADPATFWRNVLAKQDLAREVPPDRWILDPREIRTDGAETDRVYSTKACFVENFKLDPAGLELPLELLAELDPLYHLTLHAGRHAFADAATSHVDRDRVGVILAAIVLPSDSSSAITLEILGAAFEAALLKEASAGGLTVGGQSAGSPPAKRRRTHPLNSRVTSLPSALLAKALGLGGGSYTLDAACASSLYAVKLACDELRAGRADAMLAGGVSRPDCLYIQMGFTQLRAMSPSGRCAPFDESADGLVVGEGAGVLLLKRLDDAIRQGDRIYGVIRGIGLSNDIGGSLLAPMSEGQVRAMRGAYETAGWRPQDVGLIECHGTGTPLGDAVEIGSLRALWGDTGWRPGQCAIGSVKSMIGHLLTAAGAAGLIKTLLALNQRTLPPSANFSRCNAAIPLPGSAFSVQTEAADWPRQTEGRPRRAAVNAFGFGGINAHVLLEESDGRTEPPTRPTPSSPITHHSSLIAHHFPHPREPAAAPVAVVGMATNFGDAGSLMEFERWILDQDGVPRPRPANRWRGADELARARLSGCDVGGGFMDGLSVPVGKYRLPPNEIAEILPQQLLVLEVVASAMADASMPLRRRRPRVGCVIGVAVDFEATNYHLRWWLAGQVRNWARRLGLALSPDEERNWLTRLRDAACPALNAARTLGGLGSITASRVAREFELGGPSFTVSGEEASGLRALEIAVRSLRQGELDAAIIGAVDMCGDVRSVLSLHELGSLRRSDAFAVGPEDRDALLVREGAAALVLKRLDDALADGNRIYAVVRGIGAASDWSVETYSSRERAFSLARERAVADAETAAETAAAEPSRDSELSGNQKQNRDEKQSRDRKGAVPPKFAYTGAASGMVALIESCLTLHREAAPAGENSRPRQDHVAVTTLDGNCVHVVLEEVSAASNMPVSRQPERAGPSSARSGGVPPDSPLGGGARSQARALADAGDAPESRAAESPTVFVPVGGRPFHPPLPEQAVQPGYREACNAGQTEPAVVGSPGDAASSTEAGAARLVAALSDSGAATAAAHEAFLRFSKAVEEGMASALSMQAQLLALLAREGRSAVTVTTAEAAPAVRSERQAMPPGAISPVLYSREQCLQFARGSAAGVLGPEFAEVDGYPLRVRLPDEPLMLVDRVVLIEGKKKSLSSGRIVTEHDVTADAWYLDGGRCPACITIEAGQADLMLCSHLGIDFAVKGRRAYRLLDATVTLHRGLPRPGEVVRYDIRINRMVRQGDVHLLFFEFDGAAGGRPVLTMRNGCAGFFTTEEIENSGGIVLSPEETAPSPGKKPADWSWDSLVPAASASYDDAALASLRSGDLAACFGPLFADLPLDDLIRLPGGRMRLIDRVSELDPAGGRFGLGLVRAETDIHPDDWFLTCHFVDDMVMPGTLMYECCLHTLRFFLMRMGWLGQRGQVHWEPVPGVAGTLRCRGPVTPRTRQAAYQVEIKEIGFRPEPYALADALMFADGKKIVHIKDVCLQLTGATRQTLQTIWRCSAQRLPGRARLLPSRSASRPRAAAPSPSPTVASAPFIVASAPSLSAAADGRRGTLETSPPPPGSRDPASAESPSPRPVLFDRSRLLAFAIGEPSRAFGEPYRQFDHGRRMARLPGPPYLFLDRVMSSEPPPWKLEPDGWVETEYDVPPDAWYFRANRQSSMPFCVIQEIALQSCGWLAAYMGSALKSPADLSFRNLGGQATLHDEVFPDAGTLTSRVRLTNASQAGDTIIEEFEMEVRRRGGLIYSGSATFGFFSEAALARQVGIRGGKSLISTVGGGEQAASGRFRLDACPPLTPDDPDSAPGDSLALPARAMLMLDEVETLLPDGGPHGLGYIQGAASVDPRAWFFKAHFFQDPVWPGSLGLEAFLQLLKVFALDRWGEQLGRTHRFAPIAPGIDHRWLYRGQVTPSSRRVQVEAVVTERQDGPLPMLKASGFLLADGVAIYEIIDFGLSLCDNG